MYVCICNAITDQDIIEAYNQGSTDYASISARLGVGNCCGRCKETTRDLIEEQKSIEYRQNPVSIYKPSLLSRPILSV